MIIVTGGAGFIGSNFVRHWLKNSDESVLVYDNLTYAGHIDNVPRENPKVKFVEGDICDYSKFYSLLVAEKPSAIFHFAAESHVDRSLNTPEIFITTNINGTFNILRATQQFLNEFPNPKFKFMHISTDEVYGSLDHDEESFTEFSRFAPNSPYAASKASSDHFARAYHRTFKLPVIITNCSNNYGPRQVPEKLIPRMIINALAGEKLPVYGDGMNVRDWLHVEDHCTALVLLCQRGKVGETYNIGGENEVANIALVNKICEVLDDLAPKSTGSYKEQITYVDDRLGHDRRYSVNCEKIRKHLGWQPMVDFDEGLKATVQWYLENKNWTDSLNSKLEAGGK